MPSPHLIFPPSNNNQQSLFFPPISQNISLPTADRGGKEMEEEGKAEETKNKRSCTRHGQRFYTVLLVPFFLFISPLFFHRQRPRWIMRREKASMFQTSSFYCPFSAPVTGHHRGRERECSDDRRKYPA